MIDSPAWTLAELHLRRDLTVDSLHNRGATEQEFTEALAWIDQAIKKLEDTE